MIIAPPSDELLKRAEALDVERGTAEIKAFLELAQKEKCSLIFLADVLCRKGAKLRGAWHENAKQYPGLPAKFDLLEGWWFYLVYKHRMYSWVERWLLGSFTRISVQYDMADTFIKFLVIPHNRFKG